MQGRQLLYVKELFLVTSLLSNKSCSFFYFFIFYLYIMKSLYFSGGVSCSYGLVCWYWWLLFYFVGLCLLLYGQGVLSYCIGDIYFCGVYALLGW